ncbi:MAG: molybdopterin-dependent oxidoreductase [Bacteriovorax sp.]|nr:molybdopterin-dependent oxidoreductase [Bacteriovorax sp.]
MDLSEKHSLVHFPRDRRHIIRPSTQFLSAMAIIALVPVIFAWIYYKLWGLPILPHASFNFNAHTSGFPSWIRITHFLNYILLTLLMRSGLQILMDHPRLYWNMHCTPGSEWVRFTPLKIPLDKHWTARDDSRYLSPWIGLPGYRHTIGMARHWHFMSVFFWILNGVFFVILLLVTDYWKRIIPHDIQIFKDAWIVFVHYATLHMPPEPNGFYQFNPLQSLAYFVTIFIFSPLMILTGIAMSPSMDNRFKFYPLIFGNRQIARSIHFLGLLSFLGFLVVHVTLVVITGFTQNMNHIVLGSDDTHSRIGIILGGLAVTFLALVCFVAHKIAWRIPRKVQHFSAKLLAPLNQLVFDSLKPRVQYSEKDISQYFWKNGKIPANTTWEAMAQNEFKDYRLKVHGLVEEPMEFSLKDLQKMEKRSQIILNHCIQGWSGIAQWAGVPMSEIVAHVRPKPEAEFVICWSFGEGLEGGPYYATHSILETMQEQTLLVYEMNYGPLPTDYGAPLRLRIENKLGYKMVKWIESIEFVESYRKIGKGEGGKSEDDEYFGFSAGI